MRRMLVTVMAAGAIVVAMAIPAGAHPSTPLPQLFAKQIKKINAVSGEPAVLLPRSMPLDAKHYYASGGPSGSGYALAIGAIKGCRGANACFVAEFSVARAKAVFGKPVTVRGAAKAGFVAQSCGASCSPSQIDFVIQGFRYTIQANLNGPHGDRTALIKAAEASISAGAR